MGFKRCVEGCGYNLVAKGFLNINEALGLISRTVKNMIKLVLSTL